VKLNSRILLPTPSFLSHTQSGRAAVRLIFKLKYLIGSQMM